MLSKHSVYLKKGFLAYSTKFVPSITDFEILIHHYSEVHKVNDDIILLASHSSKTWAWRNMHDIFICLSKTVFVLLSPKYSLGTMD